MGNDIEDSEFEKEQAEYREKKEREYQAKKAERERLRKIAQQEEEAEKQREKEEREKVKQERKAEQDRKYEEFVKTKTSHDPGNIAVVDCPICKTDSSMSGNEVPRFGEFLRFIGILIVIPSVLGVLAAFQIMFSGIGSIQPPPFIFIIALLGAAFSLVSGTVGWLLLSKKKVLHCYNCGFILDRA